MKLSESLEPAKMKARPNIRVQISRLICTLCCMMAMTQDLAGSGALAIELRLQENTTDGCTACGCRLKDVLEAGGTRTWWMTFAEVEPADDVGWKRRGPDALSYCGEGKFKSNQNQYFKYLGTPYSIVQVRASSIERHDKSRGVEIEWTVSSLSGFTRRAKPRYNRWTAEHQRFANDGLDSVVTVLTANDREHKEFGIHELVASLRLRSLNEQVTEYGNISVSSDLPGAWILVDDVLVGRVTEASAFEIGPLAVGDRTVAVRDYSGRMAEKIVRLSPNQVVNIQLNLLGDEAGESVEELISLDMNPQGYDEFWRRRDGAFMVMIPAGEFTMGTDNMGGESDSRPAHKVHLDSFLVDKTEVTWRQYRKFVEATGAVLPPEPQWGRQDDYALSNITWDEAQAYCDWVGSRLPTEAEWEKAARGIDERKYPWGEQWDSTRCNSISGGMHRPEPVGSFPACSSPYGVLDVIGSHWQWVSDYYDENYYGISPSRNPVGPDQGSRRVRRGGYWMSHPQQLLVTRRGKAAPDWRNMSHGFRCARTIAESGP